MKSVKRESYGQGKNQEALKRVGENFDIVLGWMELTPPLRSLGINEHYRIGQKHMVLALSVTAVNQNQRDR